MGTIVFQVELVSVPFLKPFRPLFKKAVKGANPHTAGNGSVPIVNNGSENFI